MSQPQMVTIVEVRSPNANPGPHNSRVETDLAFVGSTRDKALSFVSDHPDYGGDNRHWCWCVYDVALDDPKSIPHDKIVIGKDGRVYGCPKDAWDACPPVTTSTPSR